MKKQMINIISLISILSALLCLIGLIWVMKDQWTEAKSIDMPKQTTKETTTKSNKQIQITALGDSLTRGTGDPEGKGYIGYMMEDLKTKSNKKLLLTNSAVKGQTSAQLLSQIKQKEIQRQMANADLILLTIGGNDLFQSGQALMNLDNYNKNEMEDPYLKNLQKIYSTIRSINKKATIFHIGLYNPFIEMEDSKRTSQIVREWNYDSANLAANYKKIVFVPTFDLFELNVNDYLFNDQFHPNAAGYKLIGERVSSLITFSEEKSK